MPGSLVRPKRNMHATLWERVDYRCDAAGTMRAAMRRSLPKLNELAIVVARPEWHGCGAGSRGYSTKGALLLYVPTRKLFAWTWGSYVVAA